jgi:hypothetical protein
MASTKKSEQTDTERATKETGKKPVHSSGHAAAQKAGEERAIESRSTANIGTEERPVYIKR